MLGKIAYFPSLATMFAGFPAYADTFPVSGKTVIKPK